jgi:acyl-coenzyme A thioesterase PaaI-like protein
VPADLESTVHALRALIDETRRCDAPADVLTRAQALIDEATMLLRPYRYDGEAMQSTLRGPNPLMDTMQTANPAEYFPYSPIVGPLNAIAPPVRLELDGDRMRGRLVLDAPYAGPPGTVHGGVIALIFDELLGCVNISQGYGGFTGTLTIRYERRTLLGEPIDLESWVDRVDGRKIFTKGTMSHNGVVTARAEGVFISSNMAQ